MHLKKLELQGFKSFPDKIKLEFDKGITAVVGPNGSGKSNIADAIRWVLGEQSAKSLRGCKMEDIIFAGTENRRSLGFAQVSMTIDNSEHRLPLDYSEVTISRCVFRSGESEYKINGTTCRLRDIHELFMDTGIGKEGYSIISQGRIEEILSNRPEERRILFEEAAGIVKYKNRKHEAELKLERERQNLVRINDIINELEAQVEPLAKKSETARTYLKLRDRLKLLHINIFLQDIKQLSQQLSTLDESIESLNCQKSDIEKTADSLSQKTAELKRNTAKTEQDLKAHNSKQSDLRINLEQKHNLINLTTEQIRNLSNELERLEKEISKKQELISQSQAQTQQETQQRQALEAELAKINESLLTTQSDFEGLQTFLNQGEVQIEQKNSEIIQYLKDTSEIKGQLTRFSGMYQQFNERKEQLNREIAFTTQKEAEQSAEITALEDVINQTSQQRDKLSQKMNDLTQTRDKLQAEFEKASANQSQLNKVLNDTASRHKLLSELENNYQGYYKSVKLLLQRRKDDKKLATGICGAVAELVEVPKDLETAVEIAFGGSVQNIVTKTEADASYAIEYLKKTGGGRCTFLPLTAVKSSDFGNQLAKLKAEPGFLGVAKDLVKYQAVYEPVFSHLLGRVAVVDNLENAVKIFKKYNHSVKIVTLEGELLSPGGSMSGGSKGKTENIVGRSREIKELEEAVKKLTKENEQALANISALKDKQHAVNEKIQEVTVTVQQIAVESAKNEQILKDSNSKLAEIKEKTKYAQIELSQLNEQLTATQTEIKACEAELKSVEQKISEAQNVLNSNQAGLASGRKEREEHNAKITEFKVAISSLEEKISQTKDNENRFLTLISQTEKELEQIKSEISQKQVLKENKKGDIISLQAETETDKALFESMEAQGAEFEQTKTALQAELEQTEESARETNELRVKFENELTKLSMKKEQAETENRRLYDLMWEEYEITEKTARDFEQLDLPLIQMKQEEKKVKQSIGELGEVNVSAIDEYQAVKERYEFLTAQRDDITNAESKLLVIIKDLSKLMENQFREQLAIISQNFSVVFNEMFGGGKAFLRISDEANILESGIDIIAQPPGKKLESMLLLSGGERALTAVALLFGILRMKPSPFCILDEVEAALDDANVYKFANYIKNFSYNTQFILITHRKGTMEAADVLYGVTMQEQGVSKLISVKFEDEAVS